MGKEEGNAGRSRGTTHLKYVADNEQAKEGKVLRTDLRAASETNRKGNCGEPRTASKARLILRVT